MDGSNRKDARSGIAHGIGSPSAVRYVRDLQLQDARDDLQAVLDAVIDLLEQEVLLLDLRFERPFGFLQLMPLVQFAKLGQLLEKTDTHVAAGRLLVLQEQSRQLLIDLQEVAHIILEGQLGMQHGPVVSCAYEGQQAHQVLEPIAAEGLMQRAPGAICTSRLHEQQSGGGDEPILSLGVRRWPLHECGKRFKTSYDHVVVASQGGGVFKSLIACSMLCTATEGSPDEWPRPTRNAQWRAMQ